MSQNTSIYWKDTETARRAKWMAEAEDLSLSQFVSSLVNEHWDKLNPEPPIQATCPTCQEATEFLFVSYWEDLGPGTKLYTCSNCGTTKTGQTIQEFNEFNNGHRADKVTDEKAEKEAVS